MRIDNSSRLFILFAITILGIIIPLFLPKVPQSISYHFFADDRNFLGIVNCLNVVSNLAFILVGSLGLYYLLLSPKKLSFITRQESYPYIIFFSGAILVGLGSGYYHFNPNNMTLFWDRLPLSILVTSFFIAILFERVSVKWGMRMLIPLIIVSVASVVYWEYSELIQQGDLRFYGLAQTYPILMVIIILLIYSSPYSNTYLIFLALMWYAIAKVGEFFDYGIYNLTLHLVSGHTIKHLAAAVGIFTMLKYLKQRHILKG